MAQSFASDEPTAAFYAELVKADVTGNKLVHIYDEIGGKGYDEMFDNEKQSDLDGITKKAALDFVEYMKNVSSDPEVLEIASGTGLAGRYLKQGGINNLDGLEGSKAMLDVAAEKGIYRKQIHRIMDRDEKIEELADASYDGVFCTSAITHNSIDVRDFLREATRITKKGGYIVFSLFDEKMLEKCTKAANVPDHGQRADFLKEINSYRNTDQIELLYLEKQVFEKNTPSGVDIYVYVCHVQRC